MDYYLYEFDKYSLNVLREMELKATEPQTHARFIIA